MSYILEALKKAQAERQIGSTPTIHAPTLAGSPAGQGARSKRTPVIVAMVLMAAVIAGLAAMLLRQQPAASQTPATGAPLAAAQPAAASQRLAAGQPPAEGQAPAVAQPPADVRPPVAAQPSAADQSLAAARPAAATQATAAGPAPSSNQSAAVGAPSMNVAAAQPSSAKRADAGLTAAATYGAPQAPAAHAPVPPPAVPIAAAPAPAPVSAPAPVEEQVQSLRELPEPIQRAIPQITLGGYMYSKNPADRLLLIDKVLRREGEEVAPGLVLEKLQPKQAIFGFRGYRYRVAL